MDAMAHPTSGFGAISGGRVAAKTRAKTQAVRTEPAAKPGAGAPTRVALVVVGMHRSGTSALAGVLGLRGAALPRTPIPANSRNPRGFFESEVIYSLHDELLREAGTRWDDLSPLPPGWLDSASGEVWVRRLAAATREEFGDSPLFVLKDPRLCRLLPVWKRVLSSVDVEARYVLPLRNPLECAASLTGSYGIATPVALLLWLDHFLSAERDTRGEPRAFLTYEALLADPGAVVAELARALAVTLPRTSRAADAEVEEFLQRDLRRQVAAANSIFERKDVHEWVKVAWRWALRAAEGAEEEEPAPATLDALCARLAEAESAYGPALAASEVARRRGVEALEGELAEQGKQHHETTRMLMRWIVDRVRDGDRPIPEALRATVAALDEVKPAEIPGIASTGLLISELELQIQELERERGHRTEQLAQLAQRLDRAEQDLVASEGRVAVVVRELDARQHEVERLREALADERDEHRALRAAALREGHDPRRFPRASGRGNGNAAKASPPDET